jgi:hypothetical protein
MSVRVKGGMYCRTCKKPVMAQRSGHAVRNTIGAAATAGLALKSERWLCPNCGGNASFSSDNRSEWQALGLGLLLFGLPILVGIALHSAGAFLIALPVVFVALIVISVRLSR